MNRLAGASPGARGERPFNSATGDRVAARPRRLKHRRRLIYRVLRGDPHSESAAPSHQR
jgi:hypothetical protein